MKPNLRVTAKFDPEIATKTGTPGLTRALVLDDAANLVHDIHIEYSVDDDGVYYRRLNYKLVHMAQMKTVLEEQNDRAQELLYKIATALSGSTLVSGPFDKSMFVLGPNDGTWDDVLPYDKKQRKPAKKEAK